MSAGSVAIKVEVTKQRRSLCVCPLWSQAKVWLPLTVAPLRKSGF